jgi:hypothetical protein
MAKLGIFWVYKNVVFGKTCPIEEGEEGVSGLVDSPDNHVDIWESADGYASLFPELRGTGYEQVPRGRVLFQRSRNQPVVYLDRVLNHKNTRQQIAAFFDFQADQALWRGDMHYTTVAGELDAIFSGDENTHPKG